MPPKSEAQARQDMANLLEAYAEGEDSRISTTDSTKTPDRSGMESVTNLPGATTVAPPAAATARLPTGQRWICGTKNCGTGQTQQAREKTGRKVTSNFFGRNKRETKLIHAEVWHWICRMDYQRATYRAKKKGGVLKADAKEVAQYYLDNLRTQIERISLWRPRARFTVQLERAAKERLNKYHDLMRRHGDEAAVRHHFQAASKHQATRADEPTVPAQLMQGVDYDHAEFIDAHFAGADKSLVDLHDIVAWIAGEVAAGRMFALPEIEFLISEPAPGEPITDPHTNFERWLRWKGNWRDGPEPGQEYDPDEDAGDLAQGDRTATPPSAAATDEDVPADRTTTAEHAVRHVTSDDVGSEAEVETAAGALPAATSSAGAHPANGSTHLAATLGEDLAVGLTGAGTNGSRSSKRRRAADEEGEGEGEDDNDDAASPPAAKGARTQYNTTYDPNRQPLFMRGVLDRKRALKRRSIEEVEEEDEVEEADEDRDGAGRDPPKKKTRRDNSSE